mmetsp:Transcript_68101/g.197356  ORF Transcript_68101/g.197356 Transcript_68101/m.197356 type:complete len:345 (-) Transcript_68101:785-1819(-)
MRSPGLSSSSMPEGVVGTWEATTSKRRISSSGCTCSGQSVNLTSVTSAAGPGKRASIESPSSKMTSPKRSFISQGAIFFRLAISFLRCEMCQDLDTTMPMTSSPRPVTLTSTSPTGGGAPHEALLTFSPPKEMRATVGRSSKEPAFHNNSKEHETSWSGMISPNKAFSEKASPPTPKACKHNSDGLTCNFSPTRSSNVFTIQTLRAVRRHFMAPRHIKATSTPHGPNHNSLIASCSGVACNFLLGNEPPVTGGGAPATTTPPGRRLPSVPDIGCEQRRCFRGVMEAAGAAMSACAVASAPAVASCKIAFCGGGRRPWRTKYEWWSSEQNQRPASLQPSSAGKPM